MDVKVWDRSMVALFGAVGNDVANGAWEENLALPLRAPLPLPPGLASPPPPPSNGTSPAGLRGAPAAAAPPRSSPDAAWVAVGAASDDDDDDYDAAKSVKAHNLRTPICAPVPAFRTTLHGPDCVSMTHLSPPTLDPCLRRRSIVYGWGRMHYALPDAEQRMNVCSF